MDLTIFSHVKTSVYDRQMIEKKLVLYQFTHSKSWHLNSSYFWVSND